MRPVFVFTSLLMLLIGSVAQSQVLHSSNQAPADSFGRSVSVSGNNAIVGASSNTSNSGNAYYYNLATNNGSTEDRRFPDPNASTNDFFGISASLDGNAALIGANGTNSFRGAAYFISNVTISSPTIVSLTDPGGVVNDDFGAAVSLSGVRGLIGADGSNSGRGVAYYYSNVSQPSSPMLLTDSSAVNFEAFGSTVSISGNIGLVGTSRGGAVVGIAVLFNFNDANPNLGQVHIMASDAITGDAFGNAVSLGSTNTALIGAFQRDNARGAAYYIANLSNPTSQVKLTAFDRASTSHQNDDFGESVSLSGTTALIGADAKDSGSRTGAAYLFPDVTNNNAQVKLFASGVTSFNLFGHSVSLDQDRFLIGAYFAGNGAAYAGTVSSVTTLDEASGASRSIDGISFVSTTNWIIGDVHDGNTVTLEAGNTAEVRATSDSPNPAIYIGKTSGSDNTLIVKGNVTATAVNISAAAPSGGNNNTLEIYHEDSVSPTEGKVSATTILVNNHGTILLSGSGGTDRIGDSTAITIAGGGKFDLHGLSEGSSSPGSQGVGALTLQGGSTVAFHATVNGSTLVAASGATDGLGIISILNWTGSAGSDSGAAGNDRLLFISQFPANQLSQFQFYDDNGVAFDAGAVEFSYNGYWELTPVPEPATWLAGVLAASAIGIGCWRGRRSAVAYSGNNSTR